MPAIKKNKDIIIWPNEIENTEICEWVHNLKLQIIQAFGLQEADSDDCILEIILTKTPEELRAIFLSLARELSCTWIDRALLFLLIGYKLDFDSKIWWANLDLQANPIFQLYKKEELFYNLYKEYIKLDERKKSNQLLSLALYMNETNIPSSDLVKERTQFNNSDYFIDSKKLFLEIKSNPLNEELLKKLIFVSSFQYFGKKPWYLYDQFSDTISRIDSDSIGHYIADFSCFKAYLVYELWSELWISIFNTLIERQFQAFKKNNEFLVALFENPKDLCILPYISDESAYELYREIDTHLKQWYTPKQCLVSDRYDNERKKQLKSIETTVMQRYGSHKDRFSNRKYPDYLSESLRQWLDAYLIEAKSDDLDEIIRNNPILRVNTDAVVNTRGDYGKLDISKDRDTIYWALLYLKWSHFDKKKLQKLIKSFIKLASSELKKVNSPHGYFIKLIFFLISLDQNLFTDESCKMTLQDYFITNKDHIVENLWLLWIINDCNYRKFESTRRAKSYININDRCSQELREQFISDILFTWVLGQHLQSLEITTIKKILKSFSIIPESKLFKELSIRCDKESIEADFMSSSKFEYINSAIGYYKPWTNPWVRMDELSYNLKTSLIYPPNIRSIEFNDHERALIIKRWLNNKILKSPYLLSQLICKLKNDSSGDKWVGLEISKYEEEFGSIGIQEILECIKNTKFQWVSHQEDSYTRNKVIWWFDTQSWKVMAYTAILLHALNKNFDIKLLYNECPSQEQKDSFMFTILGGKKWLEFNVPFLDNRILDKTYRKYNEWSDKLKFVSIISDLGKNNTKYVFDFADLIYDKMKTLVHENDYIEAARIYVHYMELYLGNIQNGDSTGTLLTGYFDSLDGAWEVFKAIHNWLTEIMPKNDAINAITDTYFSIE
jgi:hypothetical protein